MTDEMPAYQGLATLYPILSVNHSKGEYVRFAVHTNTIEGAWSLFKRQVYGIHHWISVKHLDAYLGEMCYRYSNRDMADGARVNDLLTQVEGRLTYKALTHDEREIPKTPSP